MSKKIHILKEKRIIALRNEGLSLSQVAKKCKVSKSTVQKVMKRCEQITDKKTKQKENSSKEKGLFCSVLCKFFAFFKKEKVSR